MKILGSSATYEDACALYSMRQANWNVLRITAQQLNAAKQVVMSGKLPTRENVAEELSRAGQNNLKFDVPKGES